MITKLLITYQILIVNLSLTHMLAKKRYPNWITFSALFLFTMVLSIVLYFTSELFVGDKPTVWFVLTGSFYILPLYMVYQIRIRDLVAIMIYCWTYTMMVSALSLGIANSSNIFTLNVRILLLQTVLFAATYYWQLKFTLNKFMVVLSKASESSRQTLIVLGLSLFGVITGVRYFVTPEEPIYFILVIVLIIIVISVYNLLFQIVQSKIKLDSAEQIVYHDTLTGIANRYSLFQDIDKLISSKQEFTLLFLDLDGLKHVNDNYGHNHGDDYLKLFARTLDKQTNGIGMSYRFAGDEFVCIIPMQEHPIDPTVLETSINEEMKKHIEFHGVSIGISRYPEDGIEPDTLMQKADRSMYGEKNSKKIRTSHLAKTND